MGFRGWPAEALDFYEGLEADNSKTYWTEHKAVYEEMVLAPMTALLDALEPEFGAGKVFRPYRDVRFSADKSPYKTNIAATLDSGGYLQLSASGLGAGNGMYMMDPAQLALYREAVAGDRTGTELESIIAAIERQSIDVTGHDMLKSAPRGYPKEHPRIEFLRFKGLIAWKDWPVAAWLGTAAAKDRVVKFLRTTRPLHDWLIKHARSA
ncbi:MAG TPA: DUF2461 domain-containing protein [Candidatus Limnocylindrales bacterium]